MRIQKKGEEQSIGYASIATADGRRYLIKSAHLMTQEEQKVWATMLSLAAWQIAEIKLESLN